MKILITGICGFVGSVLARTLLDHRPGLQISGIDNLSRRGSETNLEPLRQLGIGVHVGDIGAPSDMGHLPPADYIIDCAANASVLAGTAGTSESLPLLHQNLFGTANLLELCKKWNAGFILLSTSRVYSIRALSAIPLRASSTRFEPDPTSPSAGTLASGFSASGIAEHFSTTPPVSLYGSTKLCSELLALEYSAAFDFPAWVNRCGVMAGAGQFGKSDQGIFSFWLNSWKSGLPLRYTGFGGEGKQVRDCLHPRDLASPLLLQMGRQPEEDERVVNLSGGIANSMSLCELSSWCRDHWGNSKSERGLAESQQNTATRPFDAPWLVLNSSKAAHLWDWQPTTPIHNILDEIAAHAERHPKWLEISR